MRRLGLAIGTIISVAGLAWSISFYANAASSAKDEITAIENKLMTATNTEQIMEYIDAKEYVLYDFVPPLQYKGASMIRAHFDEAFKNATDVKGEFVELTVVTDSKLGVARSIQRFTWEKDGKLIEWTGRMTDVYHQDNGKWKLIHAHVSVPVDPITEKGQMNLKP